MNIDEILEKLTLEEKASLCSGHDFWHSKAVERLGILSIMMCDGPHGLRKQVGEGDHLGINASIETVCYPTASALASSFDRTVLERLGHALGKECQAENVAMLLGPGLNMKRSPLCGRNFEYFSEDPYLAGELGVSYINSLQSEGVSACVKHFAANNQETCRMAGSSDLDERTLHEIYLPAFEAAVKKGKVRSVMCAYNAVNGMFCSENKHLLTDVLREQWGYGGFVVTDWGAVKDRVKGLEAGLDLEMPGGGGVQDAAIVKAVQDGILDEAVLDQAVRNLLRFLSDWEEQKQDGVSVDREELSRLSGDLAAECAVLLQNDGILPLNEKNKIVFIGEYAAKPRYQGSGSSHINVVHPVGACEAAQTVPYARGFDAHSDVLDETMMAEAVTLAQEAEIAVLFVGQSDAYESEGTDRMTMELPANQNALVEAVTAVQPNTVVVLHGGAAVLLPWADKVRAILQMHLGGERTGEAAVRLLFGKANPSGKLAETWPLRLEDNPSYLNFPGYNGEVEYREGIYIGYRYYDKKKLAVRYPFGHGLSYTRFTYSELAVGKDSVTEGEEVTVTCKVKNSGNVAGAEAVQLYVGEASPNVARPVRELKGFEKIMLAPGEEKTVSFSLDSRSFAYYEPRIHDWFVESGKYVIEVGASSRDIRLVKEISVTGSREIPIHYTRTSTIGDLLRSAKGRAFMEQMMQKLHGSEEAKKAEADNLSNMGEGSERMAQAMMTEMPLGAIVTFGRMTNEQLDGLIAMLNS